MLGSLVRKNVHRWLPGWARAVAARIRERKRQAIEGPRHVLFALCDHFEPLWGGVDARTGDARVAAWEERYGQLANAFRDADGRPPRHTFFFPGEQVRPGYLERLATLARRGLGEVELHLHHDGDTAASLRRTIEASLAHLAARGHLARDGGGRLRYAFIHGDWCLANARADGTGCGVDEELPLLHDTGCYADFTFPAAPDACQPAIVNQIYWPEGDLARRRAYDWGRRARVGDARSDRVLMIEGPLALARRPGRLALRIENGALTARDPASAARVATWVEQAICVEGRPEWVFVKVHTHGAPEPQAASLLGAGGEALHRALAAHCSDGRRFRLHYVTAREMFNVASAAIAGARGDPAGYFDFALPPPPVAAR